MTGPAHNGLGLKALEKCEPLLQNPYYSLRSATIGSSCDARNAG